MERRMRGEKRSLQSVAGSPSQADSAVWWKYPHRVFRFAERQRYSLCREDLSQFLQTRLPSCQPFGFGVLWFRVVLRDLHKFDVNASNLKRPAKVASRRGKINLTAAPKRRRVFMIEFGVKRRKHSPKRPKNPSMRWWGRIHTSWQRYWTESGVEGNGREGYWEELPLCFCYVVLLLERIGMKSISSRIKRRVEVFGEKTM